MTDPRTPESERKESLLPDDLDQSAVGQSAGLFGQHGSEDAQLLAGDSAADGDVERETPPDHQGAPSSS